MYAIDDSLPFQLNIFMAQIFGILGSSVLTCYGLPWFTVTLLPLGCLYYKIQVGWDDRHVKWFLLSTQFTLAVVIVVVALQAYT